MAIDRFCPHCGAKHSEDDIFCVECGNKIASRQSSKNIMDITNESGIFTVDEQGVLIVFCCARKNEVRENVWWHLDIPEGVRVIPERAFQGCEIINRLTFPKSLRVISTGIFGAFLRSRLPHVELPDTLEELGCYLCSV